MIDCGSQCILCDLPIRYDTYKGCAHACKYCFVMRKVGIDKIEGDNTINSLKNFIKGKRTLTTSWCDWDIPLHIGGMSDPLQPLEKKLRITYKSLQLLRDANYPFVISTKGRLLGDDEYIDLLSECNCVIQVSAVCSKYDVMEKGAPTFEERMQIVKKIAPRVQRVIIRVQPYLHEVFNDVMKNIPLWAEIGVYGFIVEGIKMVKKKKGFVRVGADWVLPYDVIASDFLKLKEEAHKHGLKIYAGENRIRAMGDGYACCGTDGLAGFKPNPYNICHMVNGDMVEPTEAMQKPRSGYCFTTLVQDTVRDRYWREKSFADAMKEWYQMNKKKMDVVFGKDKRR